MHCVRKLELHWNNRASVCEQHLLHDEIKSRPGLKDREIATLLALPRHPAQEFRPASTGLDGVFDVSVRAGLVEFVIKRRHDVFPRLVKGHNPIVAAIG